MKRKKLRPRTPLFSIKVYEVPDGIACETMFRHDFFVGLPETIQRYVAGSASWAPKSKRDVN